MANKKTSKKETPLSRKAFMVLVGLITLVSSLTCWWMTFDNAPTVRLLPESTQFDTYPIAPDLLLDRG